MWMCKDWDSFKNKHLVCMGCKNLMNGSGKRAENRTVKDFIYLFVNASIL